MSVRWTKRKGGLVMTTISVKFHVPKEMIDWIVEVTEGRYTPRSALAFVRRWAPSLGDGWHTLTVCSGELTVVHTDDEASLRREGRPVYDGATVA